MRVEAARFIRPLPAAPSWWEDTETNNPARRNTVRIEELALTGCCQRDGGRRPVNAARRHFGRVIVDLWTAGQSCDFVTLEQTYRHSRVREGHVYWSSSRERGFFAHKEMDPLPDVSVVGGCFLGSCIQRSDVTAVSGQRWHGLLIHFLKKTPRRRVSRSSSVIKHQKNSVFLCDRWGGNCRMFLVYAFATLSPWRRCCCWDRN